MEVLGRIDMRTSLLWIGSNGWVVGKESQEGQSGLLWESDHSGMDYGVQSR